MISLARDPAGLDISAVPLPAVQGQVAERLPVMAKCAREAASNSRYLGQLHEAASRAPVNIGQTGRSDIHMEDDAIDIYCFEKAFAAFERKLETESGVPLVSFASHPVTEVQEGYKYDVHKRGRAALAIASWKPEAIGTGAIAGSVVEAIELPGNNLLVWDGRYGENGKAHSALRGAIGTGDELRNIEQLLFDLYRGARPACELFEEASQLLGRKYALLGYLFFLKDRSQYMPIAPKSFDTAFEVLGATLRTANRCCWENYTGFNALLSDIRDRLDERLEGEPSLLDAHSFAWMVARWLDPEDIKRATKSYRQSTSKHRFAIRRARNGQGLFRKRVVRYWKDCAVTGCPQKDLLTACHIKPWSECAPRECLDVWNGLLLTPNLHAALDAGYITFAEGGAIAVSPDLPPDAAATLGIDETLRLRRVTPKRMEYLAYHREHVFRDAQ